MLNPALCQVGYLPFLMTLSRWHCCCNGMAVCGPPAPTSKPVGKQEAADPSWMQRT